MAGLVDTQIKDSYKSVLRVDDNTDGVDTTAKYIADGEGTASVLSISTTGVGIGNSNPASYMVGADDLVVGTTSGNHGISIVGGTSGYSSIYFNDATGTNYPGVVDYDHNNDVMKLYAGSTAAFYIKSAGRVGIGTGEFQAAAVNCLAIANGTSPGALNPNQIYIGARDSAGSGTDTLSTLALFIEEGIDATALDAVGTLTTRIPIWVNDTCYWLYLDPV